uniref:Uncharacterized protein n=1 Tax=viral metagenome TaxID=1070528 RepID=A0A6C0BJK3_9ZZZZ
MFPKLLLALTLSIVLFMVYWGILTYYPEIFGFESVDPVVVVIPQPEAPMHMPMHMPMPIVSETPIPDVVPADPLRAPNEETQELRHPERLFEPAVKSKNTQIAMDSGLASANANATSDALQAFSPEMAQNGGEFMEGVFPLDSTSGSSFATF